MESTHKKDLIKVLSKLKQTKSDKFKIKYQVTLKTTLGRDTVGLEINFIK